MATRSGHSRASRGRIRSGDHDGDPAPPCQGCRAASPGPRPDPAVVPGARQLPQPGPLGRTEAPFRRHRMHGRPLAAGKRRPPEHLRGGPRSDLRRPGRDAAPFTGQHAHSRTHDPSVRTREARCRGGCAHTELLDAPRGVDRVVRRRRRTPALRAFCRRSGQWPSRGRSTARPGDRARHHHPAGQGPRDGVRRAGVGAPHAGPGRLHPFAERLPPHVGLRQLGGRGDAAARRDDAAAAA